MRMASGLWVGSAIALVSTIALGLVLHGRMMAGALTIGWWSSVAPGPDGGIQDASGTFGAPMMGVITVLPDDD
jgi:hypothetical protein